MRRDRMVVAFFFTFVFAICLTTCLIATHDEV
jgi:hypothetical protein